MLPGPAVTFAWAPTPGALEYALEVGTPGDPQRYFAGSAGTSLSRSVKGLPTDGSEVVVRMLSRDATGWHTAEQVFTGATQ